MKSDALTRKSLNLPHNGDTNVRTSVCLFCPYSSSPELFNGFLSSCTKDCRMNLILVPVLSPVVPAFREFQMVLCTRFLQNGSL